MKSSKKLLSLFLAAVMVFSVLTVMASAYTVGPEVAGNINIKYTVEKVAKVPANDVTGSEEYTADNLYGVTVWMQCDSPVYVLTAPVHYDKTRFAPVAAVMDGEAYPGADAQDSWFTDMEGAGLFAYSLGDYMNNTGMYDANGNEVAKLKAKCFGLGNSNSGGPGIVAELVSPDYELYTKWSQGLPENTGVMYVNLNVGSVAKSAYLNTIEGITTSKDWNRMFTFYFEALTDDVAGAEFGVYTDDCFTVDGDIDASGNGYFVGATTAQYGSNPNKNVVENAKIEAAVEYDLKWKQNQYRPSEKVAGAYDLGVKFGFDVSDIDIKFDDKGTSTNVARVGAEIYVNGEKINKVFESDYVYEVGTEYQYRVIIEGLAADDKTEYTIKPYLIYTDETLDPVYGEEVTVSAAAIVPQA